MSTLITVIHIVACVLVVLLVMVQSGKGAEISASFGGSSQTIFGSSGGANFFQKMTYGAAAVFMFTSLMLTIMGGQSKKSIFEGMPATAPAAPNNPIAPGGAQQQAPASGQQPAGATNPAAPAAPAAQAPAAGDTAKK